MKAAGSNRLMPDPPTCHPLCRDVERDVSSIRWLLPVGIMIGHTGPFIPANGSHAVSMKILM